MRTDPLTRRVAALLLGWVLLTSFSRADECVVLERRRLEAAEAEKGGRWLEACRAYDELLRKDRANAADYRAGYQRCMRRLHQAMRQADGPYRVALAKLSTLEALDLFDQVAVVLAAAHPDKDRTGLDGLFHSGLQELRAALEEPAFLRQHLPSVKPAALEAFKSRLAVWSAAPITDPKDARERIKDVLRAAGANGVALRPAASAAFVVEFTAGACNALDEYSLFLTPGHLAFLQAMLKGKVAGTGIEVGLKDGKLVIAQVHPKSPAAEAKLLPGDRLLRVGGASADDLPPEAAAAKLRGEAGTSVEVEIDRLTGPINLVRRPSSLPSVEFAREEHEGVQLLRLRINYFSPTTLQEVKDALAAASMGDPFKGILLDLRGNPGGLFEASVSVSDLFLPEGTIVISRSPLPEYDRPYKAEGTGPVQVPVVVLIDGETASAAEVLAGALKESRGRFPTLVIGQTTYGKGSVQRLIPLPRSALKPAALRLTVAKLFSPSDQPYTGKGVSPTLPSALEGEALLEQGRRQLLEMIDPTRRMMQMPDPTMAD